MTTKPRTTANRRSARQALGLLINLGGLAVLVHHTATLLH